MTDIDLKFIEGYCRNYFHRPFMRRLKYIYFGLEHADDVFVMSSTEDIAFKYCESLQTTGLIKIHNKDHLQMIRSWFSQFGIDRQRPMLFYLGSLMAVLGKTSWENTEIGLEHGSRGEVSLRVGESASVLIARPIDTHFTLSLLQGYVEKYSAVFFDDVVSSATLNLPDAPNKLITMPISCDSLKDGGILQTSCYDLNLVLLPGIDTLQTKSLIRKDIPYESGLRVWADNGPHCLNYGGFYNDRDISVCVVRDHICLFPKLKQEPVDDFVGR